MAPSELFARHGAVKSADRGRRHRGVRAASSRRRRGLTAGAAIW
jgi:hypothetical protein